MVEVNCETDFVARNEKFTALVSEVARDFFAHSGTQTPQLLGVVKVSEYRGSSYIPVLFLSFYLLTVMFLLILFVQFLMFLLGALLNSQS